ncbi:hypothetical protein RvY_01617 [Ramazzottius varieornatus]|uniref:Rho-GAP domain-containing protein n=1 Tax=Ramazzottius varieornatus TaxID=947166 RepID=A0A1D1US66_RAMVA|nr:hypothetical protein RvY_01617 [Ramazzottius varieornatus]
MAKRNFFDRMVQKVDQSFNRNEKSDVLSGEFEYLSKLCQTMQEVCHTLAQEIKECIPNSVNEPAKRLKKTKSWALAQTFKECGRDNFDNRNSFGFLLQFSGDTEECLAKEQIHYEARVEESVLNQLTALEADFKTVAKSRKNLHKLCADMDSAKKKYEGLARQSTISTSESNAAKITHAKTEYDDLTRQVDTQRDQLSVELLSMAPRQVDAAKVLIKHIELKKEYHQQALRIFDSIDPAVQLLKEKMIHPLFGTDLKAELDRRSAEIALVLDICCTYLYHCSLKEEGLFRIAGSSSRVKFLRAAFDAQLPMISNGTEQYQVVNLLTNDMDHHAITSLLKTYLRELPDPLPTAALYKEWMDTTRIADVEERKRVLKAVIEKLPDENYANLCFLIQFLAVVASHSEENKMTAVNLAIVIAPSLFTTGTSEKVQFDMAATSSANTIVETLITYQDELFPGDFQPSNSFPVTPNFFNYSEFEHLASASEPERSELSVPPIKRDTSPSTLAVTTTPHKEEPPVKAKKAPPPPSLPKRITVVDPVPPKTISEEVSRHSPPPIAVPEDVSSPTPKPRLYPDMSTIAASYGPTILPVAYSPPKHPSAPAVEEGTTNGVAVAPSPVPVPRNKTKPAVPPHHHTRAASADISSNKLAVNKTFMSAENKAEKNDTKFPFEGTLPERTESLIQKSIERLQIQDSSKPMLQPKPASAQLAATKASQGKPPTPPPRQIHENTYL